MKQKRVTAKTLDGFIRHLRTRGFVIGVEHYLRVRELLDSLGEDVRPRDLKTLLCPLFAVSEAQQQDFHHIFDTYFPPLLQTVPAQAKKREEAGKIIRQTVVRLALKAPLWEYVLVVILYTVFAVLAVKAAHDIFKEIPILRKTPRVEQPRTPLKTSDTAPKPVIDKFSSADSSSKPRVNALETVIDWANWIDRKNRPVYTAPSPSFYHRYYPAIRPLGLLVVLLLLLLFELRRHLDMAISRQRDKKPPFVWPLEVDVVEPGPVKDEQFYRASRHLRRRLRGEVLQLDVEQTIDATIRRAGFPDFRYSPVTRPPEYLVLIDFPNYSDHFARLFDALAGALEKEGLYVHRYFFRNDPRICFREPGGERFYLEDIRGRYSDSRLIIFGEGELFLDPLSGEPGDWLTVFHHWPERALLTPVPPADWDWHEVALAREFVVLPASLKGINALADYYELPNPQDWKAWVRADTLPPLPAPAGLENPAVLEMYLGKDAFKWLCACAVYPELHWDLTLYLGKLSCMPQHLPAEDNLLRLFRLPWFRTGSLPDDLRLALLERLDQKTNREVRETLIGLMLMEKNKPSTESAAYDTYRLHLVLNEWQLNRKQRKYRRKVEKELKRRPDDRALREYSALRQLDSTARRTRLDFRLPERVSKILFRKGVFFLGFHRAVRVGIALMAMLFLFILPEPEIFQPPINVSMKHSGPVLDALLNEEENRIHTCSGNDKCLYLRTWDSRTGELLKTESLQTITGGRRGADYSPDGSALCRWEGGGRFFWHSFEFPAGPSGVRVVFRGSGKALLFNGINHAQLINNGEYALVLMKDGLLVECSPNEADSEIRIEEGITGFTTAKSSAIFLTWKREREVRLWDDRTNEREIQEIPKGNVVGGALNPDGSRVLLWDKDGALQLWTPSETKPEFTFLHGGPILGAAFSDDGSRILSWDKEGNVKLWRASNGNPISTETVQRHIEIKGAALSRDNKKLLTWSQDGTVKYKSLDLPGKDSRTGAAGALYPELVVMDVPPAQLGAVPENDFAGGTYTMDVEKPSYPVNLTAYAIGRYEVTNAQFVHFLNENKKENHREGGGPWLSLDDKLSRVRAAGGGKFQVEEGREDEPVFGVSWYGARAYCAWLTEKTGVNYRLPTEAEWEAAGTAKVIEVPSKEDGESTVLEEPGHDMSEEGWYGEPNNDPTGGPFTVGQKRANKYGLYDMAGNVWEWCLDRWEPNHNNAREDGRAYKPEGNQKRVAKGGSWKDSYLSARASNRESFLPVPEASKMAGFRVAAAIDDGVAEEIQIKVILGIGGDRQLYTRRDFGSKWIGPHNAGGGIYDVTIMPDGRILGAGGDHQLYTREHLTANWQGPYNPQGEIFDVTTMKDGRILGVGRDGQLYTRKDLYSNWQGPHNPQGAVSAVTIMPDGRILGIGTDNQLYTREHLTANWQGPHNPHGEIFDVTIMPDGRILGVGGDGQLYIRKNLNSNWVGTPYVGGAVQSVTYLTITEN